MSPPENNDPLDALLREQNPYVADDGFTKRVVTSLPRRRGRQWPRFLLLGAAIIGWVIAAVWPWNLPPLDVSTLLSFDPQLLWPWATLAFVAAALTWASIAAIQWED